MINKFQQGGKQQDIIMQFVQGLAQTLQTDPQQVVKIAQQNPEALKAAIQVYQQTQDMNKAAQTFQQTLQQQVQAAKHGAKLNYLKSLKNQCAEDEELVYFKKGGSVGCGCKKKEDGGEVTKAQKGTAVNKFKNRKQDQATKDSIAANVYNDQEVQTIKPGNYKKNKEGKVQWTPDRTKAPYNKKEKGGNIEKNCGGSTIAKFKARCGSKLKKHHQGGSLNGIPFYQRGTSKVGVQYIKGN